MTVFNYGMGIGWMSPMTLVLQSKDSPRGTPLTDLEISWMASVVYIANVPLTGVVAYMGDAIGRKLTLLSLSASIALVWILKLSSFSTWAFILARAIIGHSAAGSYVTCPSYTKEISDDNIRGFLGSMIILFQTTGNLLMYIIGDMLSYQTILWISVSLPLIHMFLFMMMPESPSYLIKRGRVDEAKKALGWLKCRDENDEVIQQEINRLKKEQETDKDESKFAMKAIFKDRILFRAFRIALVVTLCREVCGAIPVLSFAGDIFSMASKGTGLVLSPNQQAMVLGAVQVAGSLLASGVVEKAGRKPLLFTSSLVSGLSMTVLATFFLLRANSIGAPEWLPVVTLCVCIFCDSLGLQPISVVLLGEIFSYKYRGTVFALTMATAAFADFLQLLFFKPLATAIGVHASFYFFGIVCFINAVYVILVIPETKKRTLEEIYGDLKTKKEREDENSKIKSIEVF